VDEESDFSFPAAFFDDLHHVLFVEAFSEVADALLFGESDDVDLSDVGLEFGPNGFEMCGVVVFRAAFGVSGVREIVDDADV